MPLQVFNQMDGEFSRPSFFDLNVFRAFSDELTKCAVSLEPGDIIIMSPLTAGPNAPLKSKIVDKLWAETAPRVQGELTHSAIVVDAEHVVEARMGSGITKKTFEEAVRDKKYVILRPDFSASTKRNAAHFAEKQVGKPYSIIDLIIQGLSAILPESVATDVNRRLTVQRERGSYTCSSLITAAYNKARIAELHGRVAMPADFATAKRSKIIESTAGDYTKASLGRLKEKLRNV